MTSPTSPPSTAEGGCLCGAIRYRVHGPSSAPTLCHCRSCRRAAGSPVVAWVTFPIGGFAFLAGQPVSFRSSAKVTRTFCGTCGTPLTYAHDSLPNEIDVTTCSLDDPEAYPPRDQVWTSHELAWWPGVEQLQSFPRRRRDGQSP